MTKFFTDRWEVRDAQRRNHFGVIHVPNYIPGQFSFRPIPLFTGYSFVLNKIWTGLFLKTFWTVVDMDKPHKFPCLLEYVLPGFYRIQRLSQTPYTIFWSKKVTIWNHTYNIEFIISVSTKNLEHPAFSEFTVFSEMANWLAVQLSMAINNFSSRKIFK